MIKDKLNIFDFGDGGRVVVSIKDDDVNLLIGGMVTDTVIRRCLAISGVYDEVGLA